MSTFNIKQDENFGALRQIKLIPVMNIVSIAIDTSDAVTLTYSGIGNPMDMDFTFGSARFSEPEKKTSQGVSLTQQIEFFIPGDNLTLLQKINALLNKRFFAAIFYYDEDTAWRLAGNTDKNPNDVYIGLELKKDFDSGKKPSDLKGYKFFLACESRLRAYWLSALVHI